VVTLLTPRKRDLQLVKVALSGCRSPAALGLASAASPAPGFARFPDIFGDDAHPGVLFGVGVPF
jgi:hypothetical protein